MWENDRIAQKGAMLPDGYTTSISVAENKLPKIALDYLFTLFGIGFVVQ